MNDVNISDDIRTSVHDVLSDAQELIDTIGKEGADKYSATIGRLQGNIDRARERVGDYQHSLIRRSRRAARAANDVAHEHPWAIAGTSVAIGVLIGAIVATALTQR
jgi:ElaB/YqjD/DUF883 family membrane-anchored ribosome-binding protein